MNTTIVITLVVIFGFIGELFTWLVRNDNLFVRRYVSVIRILTLAFAICAIHIAGTQSVDTTELIERNRFKYECITHLDSLRVLQSSMIDELANHLEEEHDCDIPMFDGDALDNIHEQENIIDSLYNTQL